MLNEKSDTKDSAGFRFCETSRIGTVVWKTLGEEVLVQAQMVHLLTQVEAIKGGGVRVCDSQ